MGGKVIVVGGGIAGLATAHRLRELGPDLDVVVLERSDHLGGKIHTEPFTGAPVETGAETFLMRDAGAEPSREGPVASNESSREREERAPASLAVASNESGALALARRVGLADALVHPAGVPAALAIDGELRPIPGGTLLGIPADPDAVRDVATVSGQDRDEGRPLLRDGEDVTVGALIRERLGAAVVDRLVDPLLGGVYAGRAEDLSLQATIPGLHRMAQEHHTLAQAVRAAMQAAPRPAGAPVFATVHGGLSRFVDAVAAAAHARVERGQTVRGLARAGSHWQVRAAVGRRQFEVEADAVVLAVPAAPAARLLSAVDSGVGATVGSLPYASVALVTLALPSTTVLPELSGFLVPAGQGYTVKAATFFTTKWPHLAGDVVILRASVGRHGDTGTLRRTDGALVDLVCDELPRLVGAALPAPVGRRVTRWGGALPQYGVGHVARTAEVRAALPPSLALAGAAYDGVGIAACVRSGEAAAEQVWAGLRDR